MNSSINSSKFQGWVAIRVWISQSLGFQSLPLLSPPHAPCPSPSLGPPHSSSSQDSQGPSCHFSNMGGGFGCIEWSHQVQHVRGRKSNISWEISKDLAEIRSGKQQSIVRILGAMAPLVFSSCLFFFSVIRDQLIPLKRWPISSKDGNSCLQMQWENFGVFI